MTDEEKAKLLEVGQQSSLFTDAEKNALAHKLNNDLPLDDEEKKKLTLEGYASYLLTDEEKAQLFDKVNHNLTLNDAQRVALLNSYKEKGYEERVISICVIGHVDHGKTTLVAAITKYIAGQYGCSKALTYNEVKRTKEEKARSVTIVVSTNESIIIDELAKEIIRLITNDCPGHKDYLNNMVTGSNLSDRGVFAVSSAKGFESQTDVHLRLILPIYRSIPNVNDRILYIALTQCDIIEYDSMMLDIIRMDILEKLAVYILEKVFSRVVIIPISAIDANGITVDTKVDTSSYAVSTAPEEVKQREFLHVGDLVKAIAAAPKPQRDLDKPAVMEIDKTVQVPGIGSVLVGRVSSGIIKIGDNLKLLYFKDRNNVGPVDVTVVSIEAFKTKRLKACAGDNVGILIRGNNINTDDINAGAMLIQPNALQLYKGFVGTCYVTDMLGKKADSVIQSGAELSLVVGLNVYTVMVVFLDGLSDADRARVIELVMKGAKPNKPADPQSVELKQLLDKSQFMGAKYIPNGDPVIHEVVVYACDKTRLPFNYGAIYSGQSSKRPVTSFMVDEVLK